MTKETSFDVSLAVVFFAGVLSDLWWISLPMLFAGVLWARTVANIEKESQSDV